MKLESLYFLPLFVLASSLAGCAVDDLESSVIASSGSALVEVPCNGAPEASRLGITMPVQPSPHTPPTCDEVTVFCVTPATLQNRITAGKKVLVLEDGTYTVNDISGNYLSIEGVELWAKHVGGAVLKFGIEAGGNNSVNKDFSGSKLRGLIFDIDDASHVQSQPATGPTIISAWGGATDLVIEDCRFRGNGVVNVGIYSTRGEGFEARRLEIDGLLRYGILIEGSTTLTNPMLLQDIRVWDIHDPTSNHGTGIRLGEMAALSKVHVRDVRWAGVVLNGESNGSTASYLDIDRVGVGETTGSVGVYLDNTARGVTVDHFCIGPNTRVGVNSEWDHNNACDASILSEERLKICLQPDMFPRGIDNVVEHGLSEAWLIGVHFDQGTVNGDVNHVTFRNYERAGIVFHHNVSSEANWPLYDDGSTESANTFQEPESCSTCNLTYSHWNDDTPTCETDPPPC